MTSEFDVYRPQYIDFIPPLRLSYRLPVVTNELANSNTRYVSLLSIHSLKVQKLSLILWNEK
jgi:hypothetical protein